MQVHLGFYEKEEQAAAAYDRAAINKGAKDGNKIVTNFNFNDYLAEIPMLYHLSQDELVSALGSERCALPLLVWRPFTSTPLYTWLNVFLTCLHVHALLMTHEVVSGTASARGCRCGIIHLCPKLQTEAQTDLQSCLRTDPSKLQVDVNERLQCVMSHALPARAASASRRWRCWRAALEDARRRFSRRRAPWTAPRPPTSQRCALRRSARSPSRPTKTRSMRTSAPGGARPASASERACVHPEIGKKQHLRMKTHLVFRGQD